MFDALNIHVSNFLIIYPFRFEQTVEQKAF